MQFPFETDGWTEHWTFNSKLSTWLSDNGSSNGWLLRISINHDSIDSFSRILRKEIAEKSYVEKPLMLVDIQLDVYQEHSLLFSLRKHCSQLSPRYKKRAMTFAYQDVLKCLSEHYQQESLIFRFSIDNDLYKREEENYIKIVLHRWKRIIHGWHSFQIHSRALGLELFSVIVVDQHGFANPPLTQMYSRIEQRSTLGIEEPRHFKIVGGCPTIASLNIIERELWKWYKYHRLAWEVGGNIGIMSTYVQDASLRQPAAKGRKDETLEAALNTLALRSWEQLSADRREQLQQFVSAPSSGLPLQELEVQGYIWKPTGARSQYQLVPRFARGMLLHAEVNEKELPEVTRDLLGLFMLCRPLAVQIMEQSVYIEQGLHQFFGRHLSQGILHSISTDSVLERQITESRKKYDSKYKKKIPSRVELLVSPNEDLRFCTLGQSIQLLRSLQEKKVIQIPLNLLPLLERVTNIRNMATHNYWVSFDNVQVIWKLRKYI